jgi:hypothetical protein
MIARADRKCRPPLNRRPGMHDEWPSMISPLREHKAMTITKTALAAAILAVMAVSAQAQQGPTRQIQVLPAPNNVAQAPAVAADPAPAKSEGEAPAADALAADAAPAPEAAPKVVAPKVAPKVIVAAPDARPAPKFVEPKFAPPVRKAFGYGGYGYGKRHICH